jgi:hypothetical protein
MRNSNTHARAHDRAGDGEPEYFARSFYEATYLYYAGLPLLRVTGGVGSAKIFFGNKDGVAKRAADDFNAADASVGCKSFCQALSQLKRQVDEALGRRPVSRPEAVHSNRKPPATAAT